MKSSHLIVLTIALVALVTLSWTRSLDHVALDVTEAGLKRALTTAALARAFNGVVSVAQGTEVAIQPVGVGVTLTLGEALDPINDLIERFSFLALIASVSLGVQLLLAEIFSTLWFSVLVTGCAVLLLALLLYAKKTARTTPTLAFGVRLLTAIILVRFLFVATLLVTHWIDSEFLSDRHAAAIAQLESTKVDIEAIQESTPAPVEDGGIFEGIRDLVDSSRETLNLRAQLDALMAKVEASAEEIVNLIVVFLLQTLVVPIATIALLWAALRGWFLRPLPSGDRSA